MDQEGSIELLAVERSKRTRPSEAGELALSVYQQLPYGLVVVDKEGSVISANPASVEMGWGLETGGPPTACHEMFSCRRPGGPCQHGCLVQRAIQTDDQLPEIRIDTPLGSPVSAVWVTVTPLGSDSGVVLHLRPGDAGIAGDARTRTGSRDLN